MRIAKHPTTSAQMTVPDYIKSYGHRPIAGTDLRPHPRCPFCGQGLTIVAGKTDYTTGHFAHFPNSGFCPSKEPAGRPYLRLSPVDPDPAHGDYLRKMFWKYWERIYGRLCDLVPYLSLNEFIALIREANRLRVWEYRHLELWEIPYVFVLLADFPAKTGIKKNGKPCRIYWFRFWYAPSVKSIDDLWIRPEIEPTLFRASFEQPRRDGTIPGYDKLVKFYPIHQDRDYLANQPEDPIKGWVRKEVEERLPMLLRF
ncbi:MAG: hypothetical protein HZC23_15820 [Rhodocyclales bacterium]|nr:hypothetical protein [Rhodocyclales bacterium]